MTEPEYIQLGNLQRLRAMDYFASMLIARSPIDRGALSEIREQLYHWIDRLEREIKVTPGDADQPGESHGND